jgi:septal ring factor EnvC (AmiA/AmiB activator)
LLALLALPVLAALVALLAVAPIPSGSGRVFAQESGQGAGQAAADTGRIEPDTSATRPTDADVNLKEQELERLRRELDEKRSEAANLAGQEQDIAGEIEDLNRDINVNQSILRKLGEKRSVLLEDLGYAQQDLIQAQASLGAAGDMLGGRLRGIYKFGRGQVMEVVLTSKTFADLTKRIYYLSVVAGRDRELISAFETTVETKQVLVDHIESKKMKLEQTEGEVAEENRNLAARKEERDALVARLKDKRYYYEDMARDLQSASRAIEEMLGRFEAGREEAGAAGSSFAGRAGRLVWPCQGEVIASFGVETHPKFGTIIKNNGIDIKASAGSRVRTVAKGLVSYAGPLTGYGNAVIVDHGGGYYTLYGRLESVLVATGYEVLEGDPLGFVGETSAPEGAVLHFEIRQGKKALDPEAWLLR